MAEELPLEIIRHSASHILAAVVLKLFPTAKLGIGPSIEDGFYYDFDLPRTLNPEDLIEIEKEMKKLIKENQLFMKFVLNKKAALDLMEKHSQPYKAELIQDLAQAQDEFTFYQNGDFIDLCKGPHVVSTSEVGAVKLLKISGAYWKGSEKNKMLQRIYGTAWHTEADVAEYVKKLEEAEKRDHRLLGKVLDLFSITQEAGSGLVLWHPKGAKIRHAIEDYWNKEHINNDYELLYTPHIGRSFLWETSGHLENYKENMYSPMDIEGEPYYIKPMNCPFHILIYKRKLHSYRDLPYRWAELGTVYRYERSGVLHGLMRVRGFTQDDAHIFCTPSQVKAEVSRVLKFCFDILNRFGFKNYKVFVSTRPKEKYVGEISLWNKAQEALIEAIKQTGLPYEVDEGGGAFYGPKIDIKIQDAIGREWQCSTIQLDFNLPARFDMSFIAEDGQKHQPIMIHRALLGSLERFLGILIEHYDGKFPFWLAPDQVKVLTLSDEPNSFIDSVVQKLKQTGIRVATDFSGEKLGHKIRQAIMEKVPYMFIIGKKEIENGQISIRSRDDGDLGLFSISDIIAKINNS